MNLIAAQPLLRRETNAEIPQIFGSRFVKHRGSTELCWDGSDCADAAVEQACSCCMLVRPADARLTRTLKRKTEASLPPFSDFD
jgi:hypothetical protein